MAKNWQKVELVMRNGKVALEPVKEKIKSNPVKTPNINTIKSLSYEDLKKEGDKAFVENQFNDDKLIDAYNNKKLKSQTAIKRAKAIIKRRAKEEAAAAEKAAKKERRDKIVDTNTALA